MRAFSIIATLAALCPMLCYAQYLTASTMPNVGECTDAVYMVNITDFNNTLADVKLELAAKTYIVQDNLTKFISPPYEFSMYCENGWVTPDSPIECWRKAMINVTDLTCGAFGTEPVQLELWLGWTNVTQNTFYRNWIACDNVVCGRLGWDASGCSIQQKKCDPVTKGLQTIGLVTPGSTSSLVVSVAKHISGTDHLAILNEADVQDYWDESKWTSVTDSWGKNCLGLYSEEYDESFCKDDLIQGVQAGFKTEYCYVRFNMMGNETGHAPNVTSAIELSQMLGIHIAFGGTTLAKNQFIYPGYRLARDEELESPVVAVALVAGFIGGLIGSSGARSRAQEALDTARQALSVATEALILVKELAAVVSSFATDVWATFNRVQEQIEQVVGWVNMELLKLNAQIADARLVGEVRFSILSSAIASLSAQVSVTFQAIFEYIYQQIMTEMIQSDTVRINDRIALAGFNALKEVEGTGSWPAGYGVGVGTNGTFASVIPGSRKALISMPLRPGQTVGDAFVAYVFPICKPSSHPVLSVRSSFRSQAPIMTGVVSSMLQMFSQDPMGYCVQMNNLTSPYDEDALYTPMPISSGLSMTDDVYAHSRRFRGIRGFAMPTTLSNCMGSLGAFRRTDEPPVGELHTNDGIMLARIYHSQPTDLQGFVQTGGAMLEVVEILPCFFNVRALGYQVKYQKTGISQYQIGMGDDLVTVSPGETITATVTELTTRPISHTSQSLKSYLEGFQLSLPCDDGAGLVSILGGAASSAFSNDIKLLAAKEYGVKPDDAQYPIYYRNSTSHKINKININITDVTEKTKNIEERADAALERANDILASSFGGDECNLMDWSGCNGFDIIVWVLVWGCIGLILGKCALWLWSMASKTSSDVSSSRSAKKYQKLSMKDVSIAAAMMMLLVGTCKAEVYTICSGTDGINIVTERTFEQYKIARQINHLSATLWWESGSNQAVGLTGCENTGVWKGCPGSGDVIDSTTDEIKDLMSISYKKVMWGACHLEAIANLPSSTREAVAGMTTMIEERMLSTETVIEMTVTSTTAESFETDIPIASETPEDISEEKEAHKDVEENQTTTERARSISTMEEMESQGNEENTLFSESERVSGAQGTGDAVGSDTGSGSSWAIPIGIGMVCIACVIVVVARKRRTIVTEPTKEEPIYATADSNGNSDYVSQYDTRVMECWDENNVPIETGMKTRFVDDDSVRAGEGKIRPPTIQPLSQGARRHQTHIGTNGLTLALVCLVLSIGLCSGDSSVAQIVGEPWIQATGVNSSAPATNTTTTTTSTTVPTTVPACTIEEYVAVTHGTYDEGTATRPVLTQIEEMCCVVPALTCGLVGPIMDCSNGDIGFRVFFWMSMASVSIVMVMKIGKIIANAVRAASDLAADSMVRLVTEAMCPDQFALDYTIYGPRDAKKENKLYCGKITLVHTEQGPRPAIYAQSVPMDKGVPAAYPAVTFITHRQIWILQNGCLICDEEESGHCVVVGAGEEDKIVYFNKVWTIETGSTMGLTHEEAEMIRTKTGSIEVPMSLVVGPTTGTRAKSMARSSMLKGFGNMTYAVSMVIASLCTVNGEIWRKDCRLGETSSPCCRPDEVRTFDLLIAFFVLSGAMLVFYLIDMRQVLIRKAVPYIASLSKGKRGAAAMGARRVGILGMVSFLVVGVVSAPINAQMEWHDEAGCSIDSFNSCSAGHKAVYIIVFIVGGFFILTALQCLWTLMKFMACCRRYAARSKAPTTTEKDAVDLRGILMGLQNMMNREK